MEAIQSYWTYSGQGLKWTLSHWLEMETIKKHYCDVTLNLLFATFSKNKKVKLLRVFVDFFDWMAVPKSLIWNNIIDKNAFVKGVI